MWTKSPAPHHEENPGPDRPDHERHGVDRAGGVSLVDLPAAGCVRAAHGRLRHLVRHRRGSAAVLAHGHRLRRALQALSGAGSSYFFAEQAFLSKTQAYKFARLAKFIIGWASHLYYWVYPGVMVGVTAILVGYLAGQFLPDTFNGTINSPTLMIGFCVLFSFGVAYIAYRGVNGTTGVNMAINVIQISRLVDLLGHRHRLPRSATAGWHRSGFHYSNGNRRDLPGRSDANDAGRQGQAVQDQGPTMPTPKADDKGQPVSRRRTAWSPRTI